MRPLRARSKTSSGFQVSRNAGEKRPTAPAARIVIGLWPEGDAILRDAGAQQLLGADACVGSLRSAVDATLAAIRGPG